MMWNLHVTDDDIFMYYLCREANYAIEKWIIDVYRMCRFIIMFFGFICALFVSWHRDWRSLPSPWLTGEDSSHSEGIKTVRSIENSLGESQSRGSHSCWCLTIQIVLRHVQYNTKRQPEDLTPMHLGRFNTNAFRSMHQWHSAERCRWVVVKSVDDH